ncbi:MAG: hypothetical protein GWP08_07225 [Nitrospiraceae bacterium]|nr:hypothetical protein [Nitrospiraceae bacterium]
MFDELVETLRTLLPEFGKRLAIDSKAIDSHGRPTKHEEQDGRRDTAPSALATTPRTEAVMIRAASKASDREMGGLNLENAILEGETL